MNKIKNFLQRHPEMEKELGLSEDLVIVKKKHWEHVQEFFTGISQVISEDQKEKCKSPVTNQKVICPECEGRGFKQALRCDRCWGDGEIFEHNLKPKELNKI